MARAGLIAYRHPPAPLGVKRSVMAMNSIEQQIASELGVRGEQVAAAVELLGEGATVPFIARYRKEMTGELDDTQLR